MTANTTPDAEMPPKDVLEAMLDAWVATHGEFLLVRMKAALSCDAYRAWLQEKKNAAFMEGYEKGVINDF